MYKSKHNSPVKLNSSSNNKFVFLILHATLTILLTLVFAGCHKTTEPQASSLSGKVVLENDTGDPSLNPVDYSGVSIRLYELAVIDTTLIRVNQRHPQIGMVVNQECAFDHRGSTLSKSAVSGPDGSFLIRGIKPGKYNLAFIKAGWGIKYLLDGELTSGANDLADLLTNRQRDYVKVRNNLGKSSLDHVSLNPAISLTSYIDNSFVFKADHTYFIENDLTVISSVVIEPGTLILVAPGCRIDFYGPVSCPSIGQKWSLTSSFGMYDDYQVPDASNEFCSKVTISGTSPVTIYADLFRYFFFESYFSKFFNSVL